MNNIEKLQAKLTDGSCALITSDVNRRFFTGMKSSAGAAVIFPQAAYLLVDFRYIEKARECACCEVIEQKKLYEQVKELLCKHNARNIMIEGGEMTVSSFDKLRENLGGEHEYNTAELSGIIEGIRAVKTPEELEKMQRAQDIADGAFTFVTENIIEEGVTELELARAIDFFMLSHGAEAVSFDTIALCGENTSLPHGVPSDRKIRKGEFVLMDFGAVYQGYHSDMTRTVCVGEPTEEMREVYNIVLEAQMKCLDYAKTGIVCKDLDAVARDYITEKGYGDAFGHGLGHSVGMEIHESPAANTRDTTILQKNMVMTIEPGIYLPKKFGVRIEDCIYFTENGYNNFVSSPKNLLIL